MADPEPALTCLFLWPGYGILSPAFHYLSQKTGSLWFRLKGETVLSRVLRKNKRPLIWVIVSAAVLVLAAAVLLWMFSHYVLLTGKLIPVDSAELDLSGKKVAVSKLLRLTGPELLNLEDCGITVDDYETLAAAFPGCDIRWSVPLSSGSFSNKSREITLAALNDSDLPLFAFFELLEKCDAHGVPDWERLSQLEKLYPEVKFNWDILIDGRYYSSDATEIALEGTVAHSELEEKLPLFKTLKEVSVEDGLLTVDDKLALTSGFPEISFRWNVEGFGMQLPNDTDSLDFSRNNGVDLDQLIYVAPLFPNVRSIDFTGCSYTDDEMLEVMKAFPEADVNWKMTIYGVEVSSLDEEIDLSGIEISDTSEIEDALKYLKNLKKVVMSDCGIDNEDMDALNRRHEDVRFVWTVYFGKKYFLRTDTDYFISSLFTGQAANPMDLNDETIEPLKYCTDMVALDVGHQLFTNADFCKDMKELRFFIGAGGRLSDISALANCKKLYYLELSFSPVHDLSRLLECKELRHLNICNCPTAESLDALAQMTWLERCFMSGGMCYDDKKDREYVSSDEFLPNTYKWLVGVNFYVAWRSDPSYFEMRDALHAYYMIRKPESMSEGQDG